VKSGKGHRKSWRGTKFLPDDPVDGTPDGRFRGVKLIPIELGTGG